MGGIYVGECVEEGVGRALLASGGESPYTLLSA